MTCLMHQAESTIGPWNDCALLAEFREAILNQHNRRRAHHGSGQLTLDNNLNRWAQEWADKVADRDRLSHRPDCDLVYGESLHRDYWTASATVEEMAKTLCYDLYSEVCQFKFGCLLPRNLADVDNFTQMVWYGTREMGIGVAKGKSGFVYSVLNYNPPGNEISTIRDNVFPAGTIFISNRHVGPTRHCVKKRGGHPDIDAFRQSLTDEMNSYRKLHGVPFLKNADYLNHVAQKWADQLAERDCVDSSTSVYGESVYQLVTTDGEDYPSPKEICESFVDQSVNYSYTSEDADRVAGHYTQMVWKGTSAIGIGIRKAESGNVYVVCNYCRPGNVTGEYAKNVFRPIRKSIGQRQCVVPV